MNRNKLEPHDGSSGKVFKAKDSAWVRSMGLPPGGRWTKIKRTAREYLPGSTLTGA